MFVVLWVLGLLLYAVLIERCEGCALCECCAFVGVGGSATATEWARIGLCSEYRLLLRGGAVGAEYVFLYLSELWRLYSPYFAVKYVELALCVDHSGDCCSLARGGCGLVLLDLECLPLLLWWQADGVEHNV